MPNPPVQPFAVRSRQLRLAAGMIAAALLALAYPAIAQTPPAQAPAAKTAPAPAPPTKAAPAQTAPATPPAAAAPPAPTMPSKATEAAPQAVPGFWDPRRRPDRPDLSRLTVIRFLTETDYPPFNFTGPDGNPAGFNVDLARALCDEIKVTCTIQMRRFETLIDALATNRGDAIIASMAVTPQLRAKVDFTDPYYRAPARFVSRRDNAMPEIRPEYLEGKKVGVIAGTSHEAYLKAMFTDAEIHSYPDNDALRAALRRGEVDFIFGDAISLAFWINGTDSAECCAFAGGPFVESRYFGEGVGIAVRKGNDLLRQSLNWALFRIWEKGRFTDLWLRYFSVSPF
ncbi:transporter substrate-binding domain-containing protein [Bradyrhizobium sp. 33ap4]|uniref:transporter substrate-binding domain-containing protein n=1 Tax=Bradyrhizobium sp. 33ap4 TaxID=3061630 RepID=UPI00292F1669|nr:transporter substrate-binding domain-containing protein [Bradyrhizobium sp. 33ap4]